MRDIKNKDGFVPGKLLDILDIKILICYLLNSINEPFSKEKTVELIVKNDLADYFNIREAICELVESGNLTEDKDGNIAVTESGRNVATTLESNLPFTVREKAVKESVKMRTRSRREKENDVIITKTDNGIRVNCIIKDGDQELMRLNLLVADALQADMIKERFLSDPAELYKSVVYKLLSDKKD